MSSVVNRRNKILQQLSINGSVRVADLVQLLNVSGETIRKDLKALEEHGILKREHGGATLISSNEEDEIDLRHTENMEAKARIAREALKYIPTEEPLAIALDAGSTSYCLAQLLAQRNGQTIITSSIPIAELFNGDKNDVYLLGGKLRQKDRSLYGQWALHFISSIRISVAILGSSGVKNHNGLCAVTFDDSDIKRAYIKNSERSIALLDSSKFQKCSMVESMRWEEVDIVITDSGIPKEVKDALEKKTNLIIV